MKTNIKMCVLLIAFFFLGVSIAHSQMYGTGYPYYYQYTNPYPALSLAVGQSTTVNVGGGQHSTTSTNPNVAQYYVLDGVLTITARYPGSTTITVCGGSSYYGCTNVYVTVQGTPNTYSYYGSPDCYYYYYNNYNPYPYEPLVDTRSVRVDIGERRRLQIYTQSRYRDVYVSDNTNSRVASATISDDELVLKGLRRGDTAVTICDDSICTTVYVSVGD